MNSTPGKFNNIKFRQNCTGNFYNKNEKKLWAAIETDHRIKVLDLNIKRLSKQDRKLAELNVKHQGQFLLFKFLCPCGDERVELFSLPSNWKNEVLVYEQLLREYTYKHLKEEGLMQ